MEDGFELSEASNTPVMLMVRIRSCHVTGQFTTRDNQRPPLTVREALSNPRSDFARVVLPPMSYAHEQDKVKNRWPAAERFIVERKLNEVFGPHDGARRHRRCKGACTTASSARCSGWVWPTSMARRRCRFTC